MTSARRLTGQPLGYILTRLHAEGTSKKKPSADASDSETGLHELISALRKLEQEDNQPLPIVTETY